MRTFQADEAAKLLKPIIKEKSIELLKAKPQRVYDLLLEGKLKPYSTRLVEMTLKSGVVEQIEQKGFDEAALVPFIVDECGLKKVVATQVVGMYATLFGGQHMAEWRAKELQGFEEFCSKASTLSVDVEAAWGCHSGSVDCYFKASVEVHVTDKQLLKQTLAAELKKNPYMSADEILDFLEEKLNEKTDDDFAYYVTGDDYYEPVTEDYVGNFDDVLDAFCTATGLSYEVREAEGYSDDFEPY